MTRHEIFPVIRDQAQMIQRIECFACGATGKNSLSGHSKAGNDQLASHFRRHGWDVDLRHMRHRCPECVVKEMERQRKEKEAKKMEKLSVVTSPNSALAKKIMSDLLFEHYDLTAQDYKSGWDDARIAKESGLSEQFVSTRRASDYGPVSPPKKAIMREAAGMAEKIRQMSKGFLDVATVLERDSQVLLGEATRLEAILAEESKKAGKTA